MIVRRRGNHFELDGRINGRRVRKKIEGCRTKREAQAFADAYWGDLRKKELAGESMPGRVEKTLLVRDVLTSYCESRAGAVVDSWLKRLRQISRDVSAYFGDDARFCALNDTLLARFRNHRANDGVTAKTINMELGFIVAAGRYARAQGLISLLPWRKAERATNRSADQSWTFLEADEIDRLLSVLRNGVDPSIKRKDGCTRRVKVRFELDLYCRVLFLLNSGARRGEMDRLKWSDIDTSRGQVRIVTRKAARSGRNAKARHVPMNASLAEMFDTMERGRPSDLVFGADGNLGRRLKAALRWAGVERHVRVHDLRHTFASHLAMQGIPIYSISKLLGHSNTTMTERYAHLSPGALQEAVNVLNFGSTGDAARVIGVESA